MMAEVNRGDVHVYTTGSRPAPAEVTVTLFCKQRAASCCTKPWQWAVDWLSQWHGRKVLAAALTAAPKPDTSCSHQ